MFFASFLPIAIAAPAKAETQPAPSPSIGEAAKPVAPLMGEGKGERVIFTKGLLTVQAKDVTLKSLLEEIGQKAGIGAESSPSLGNHKISVQFESLTLEKGLRAILQSAGVVNYALVYAQSQQPGKIGKWVIDKIYLKEEGTSNDATKVTKTQEKKPQGKVSLDKEPLDKKPLDKEPFFDKKLDRFVEVVKGEVLVRFKKGLTNDEIGTILKKLGATIIKRNNALNIYRLKIPQEIPVSEFIEQHGKDENLNLIDPNFIASVLATPTLPPNDPSFPSQWALAKIQTDKGWEVTTGSPNLIVAILDTGVALTHPDLKNKIRLGTDIVNADSDPSDDHGHGTHVAGIVGAEGNNGVGIAGVSWGSLLMPIKVITALGEGAYSDVVEGIVYAADNGARVLNFSIGGYSYSQTLGDAVEYAHGKGAVLVAAGGNEDSNDPIYPAAYPNVIGVSATDSTDLIWSPSNQGAYIKLSAPGTDILSTTLNNAYARATGTSASTAYVSGVVALILSKNPDFSNTQVEQILYQTADDLGDKGLDQNFGYGRLNAAKALEVASIEVHDVAVVRIRVEPQTFKVGEPAQIIVTVQNQGTFVEKDLSVTVSVNDMLAEEAKKIEKIKPGESVEVGFAWTPPSQHAGAIAIIAHVGTIKGEVDLEDNARKIQYGIALSPDEKVFTLYRYYGPVHQWITLQAYRKLVQVKPNDQLRSCTKITWTS